jgi:hypothetical protein
MLLRNVSGATQRVTTIEGKKDIKDQEVFKVTAVKGAELKRNYKTIFAEVEAEEVEVEKKPLKSKK